MTTRKLPNCRRCGRPRGEHQAKTLACPLGRKTRVGHTSFHRDQYFDVCPHDVAMLSEREKDRP
jgi:hypothetical protein